MEHSEQLNELYKGLNTFRQQVKQPVKDAKNPFFKSDYVTLEGVQNSIDAALKGTGLSYLQLVSNTQTGVAVETIVTHESGQWVSSGALELNPQKKDPQGYGSAITYQKRYQLAAMFGISSDLDDDGNAGTFVTPKQQTKTQSRIKTTKSVSKLEQLKQNYTALMAKVCDAKKLKAADLQAELIKGLTGTNEERYEAMITKLEMMLQGQQEEQQLNI